MSIQIRFRLSRADFVAATVLINRKPLKTRLLRTVLLALIPPIAGILAGMLANGMAVADLPKLADSALLPKFLPSLVLTGVLPIPVFFSHWLTGALAFFRYPHIQAAKSETTLSVSDSGVISEISDASMRLNWPSISRLIETPSRFFLVYDYLMVEVLPRRAFANAAEYQSALAFVKSKLNPDVLHEVR